MHSFQLMFKKYIIFLIILCQVEATNAYAGVTPPLCVVRPLPLPQAVMDAGVGESAGFNNILVVEKNPLKNEQNFNQFNVLRSDIALLVAQSRDFRNSWLSTTPPTASVAASKLTQLKASLSEFKQKAIQLLTASPAKLRSEFQPLFAAYFQVAFNLVQSELMLDPQQLKNLSAYNSVYELSLNLNDYDDVFLSTKSEIDGVQIQRIRQSKSTTSKYQLTIEEKKILLALQRALGRSPVIRQKGNAYLLTVRCLLGHQVIRSYISNNLMLEKISQSLPIAENTPICLNVTAQDIFRVEHEAQTTFAFNTTAKLSLFSAVPSFAMVLSETDKALFTVKSGDKSALLDLPSYLLYEHKKEFEPNDKNEVDVAATKLATERVNRIREFASRLGSTNTKAMDTLTTFFDHPILKTQLQNILAECEFTNKFTGDNGKEKFEQMLSDLLDAETLYFYDQFDQAKEFSAVLYNANNEELKEELIRYIYNNKLRSLSQALYEVMSHYTPAISTVDVQSIVARIKTEVLEPAIRNILKQAVAQPEVQAWLNDSVTKTKANMQFGAIFKNLRNSSDRAMVQIAEMLSLINKIQEEKDIKKIPDEVLKKVAYSSAAVAQYYQEKFGEVNPLTQSQVAPILKMTDTGEMRAALHNIQNGLLNEVNRRGGSILGIATPNLKGQIWEWLTTWGTPTEDKLRREEIANDFNVLHKIASALGGNERMQPRNTLYDAVADQLPQLNASELQEFLNYYLNFLKDEVVKSAPLIDIQVIAAPDHAQSKRELPLYLALENSSAKSPYNKGLITIAIKKSLANLTQHMETIAQAKAIDDYKPFIRDTNIIETLLGFEEIKKVLLTHDITKNPDLEIYDLDQDTQIFADLASQHIHLKKRWIEEAGAIKKLHADFSRSVSIAALPLTMGFFTRVIAARLPAYVGGSYVASTLLTASRTMAPAISLYWSVVMKQLALSAGYSGYCWWDNIRNAEALDSYRYSSAATDAILSPQDYKTQKDYFDFESRECRQHFFTSLFWLSFPRVSEWSLKGYNKAQKYFVERNEKYMTNWSAHNPNPLAAETNRIATASRLRTGLTAANRYEQTVNSLMHEFRALNMNNPSFIIRDLDLALHNIKVSGNAYQIKCAEEAYRRIVTEAAKTIRPYVDMQKTPITTEIYAKVFFGGQKFYQAEFPAFIKKLDEINKSSGGAQ